MRLNKNERPPLNAMRSGGGFLLPGYVREFKSGDDFNYESCISCLNKSINACVRVGNSRLPGVTHQTVSAGIDHSGKTRSRRPSFS